MSTTSVLEARIRSTTSGVQFHAAGGGAGLGISYMDVDYGRTRGGGIDGRLGDLLGSDGNQIGSGRGVAAAGDGAGYEYSGHSELDFLCWGRAMGRPSSEAAQLGAVGPFNHHELAVEPNAAEWVPPVAIEIRRERPGHLVQRIPGI